MVVYQRNSPSNFPVSYVLPVLDKVGPHHIRNG